MNYKEILSEKIKKLEKLYEESKDKTNKEMCRYLKGDYKYAYLTGYWIPYLVSGECEVCGIKLAVPEFCKKFYCPVCGTEIVHNKNCMDTFLTYLYSSKNI